MCFHNYPLVQYMLSCAPDGLNHVEKVYCKVLHNYNYIMCILLPSGQQQPTSVPKFNNSALIGVSAASLLMTVTLTIIIITQCLLMVRMRKSKDVVQRNETYTEVMIPTTMKSDIPVTTNEAYALYKITGGSEEVTYELVK